MKKETIIIEIGNDGKVVGIFASCDVNVVIMDHSKKFIDDDIKVEPTIKHIANYSADGKMTVELAIAKLESRSASMIKSILGDFSKLLK